jgi:hypothetical protein
MSQFDEHLLKGLQRAVMKTLLVALLLLSMTSAAGADDAAAPTPPSGSLEVPELVYDAGKVKQGVTIRHEFVLKNVGAAELSVDAKPG